MSSLVIYLKHGRVRMFGKTDEVLDVYVSESNGGSVNEK